MHNNTIEYNKFQLHQIRKETKILRIYFNNHCGGKAVVNAMQFKDMIGISYQQAKEGCWNVHVHRLKSKREPSRALAQEIRERMLFQIYDFSSFGRLNIASGIQLLL